MWNLLFLVPLVLAYSVFGEDSKDAACRTFVKCLSDVEEARAQCSNKQNATTPPKKNESGECSSIGSKEEELRGLRAKQGEQQRDCLTKSLQDHCQKLFSNYTSGPSPNSRSRRAADGNSTTSNPKHQGGKGGKGGKESGKGGHGQNKQCFHEAQAKEHVCRELHACCSESMPCELKFHLSPLHNQIYQVELDLFNLRRRCQQSKGKPSGASTNATVTPSANATVAGPLIHHEDDIDSRTRWWDSYPKRGYSTRARPRDAFSSYLDQAFGHPQRLARSASAIGLTYYREAVVSEKPVIRSPSFSSLSPSHGLPHDLRVATRYVPAFRHRRTDTEKWYTNAYSPAKHINTHVAVSKPYVTPSFFYPNFVHVPYYTKVVDKPRFEFDKKGYVKRSSDYLQGYVADRLRYDNYSLPYVYNSYEKKVDNRYLRFVRGAPESFVGVGLGLPKHPAGTEQQRIYRLTGRLIY